MLKVILFDLDHTLYDRYATLELTLPVCWERVKEFFRDDITYEQFKELMIACDKLHNYDTWNDRISYLKEHNALKHIPDTDDFRYRFNSSMGGFAVHYDFTFKLLTNLRSMGYKIGLVTNGFEEIQRAKLKSLNFSEYFDLIYLCGEKGIQKPNPEPFWEAAKQLGAKPEECIYVGDNPRNDVFGAKNAGMKSVWVATLGPWRYDECPRPDYTVASISELEDLIPVIAKDME